MDKTVNGARCNDVEMMATADGFSAAASSRGGVVILFGDTMHGQIIARVAGIGYDPGVDFCISRAHRAQVSYSAG